MKHCRVMVADRSAPTVTVNVHQVPVGVLFQPSWEQHDGVGIGVKAPELDVEVPAGGSVRSARGS